MKKLQRLSVLALLTISITACSTLRKPFKLLNFSTQCAELGNEVEVSRHGKYKINDVEVTRRVADSMCSEIAKRQVVQFKN